ncbi:glycosyltransferase family 9 protein [Frigoriflavimonas asaccharolytica]|nr:glycosyltransferase family 9 protein [Frigoriflavimonas asaccharolytica]
MTILAYRFSAFGDVAMLAPVFREFLEQNPEVKIIIVSRENFSDLFSDIENVDFVGVDLDQYKGFFGMRKLANQLIAKYQPTHIADFHDVIRTKILNKIFKSKGYSVFKIDKDKEEKAVLTDVWNLDKKQLKRTVERYADVFRSMGLNLELSHLLRPKSAQKAGIGIAPFAQHFGKMLPLEKSFELAQKLSENHALYFFGGGESEVEILKDWEELIPNSQSVAGKLSLKAELELISELKLMISMDSANMHLASLMGTRCVSIWGSTHPFAGFLGYGQKLEDVVQVKDLTCRPCSVFGDKECYRGDWACLHEIRIQEILEKVEKALS